MNNDIQHYYSAENTRLLQRERLIETTRHFSVFVLAGMIFFTFGFPDTSSHLVLILGSLVIFLFQIFESRVYRLALLSGDRLRLIEANIYAPSLDSSVQPDKDWEKNLVQHMLLSKHVIRFPAAFAATVFKAYFLIFITLDVCWFAKLYLFPSPALSWHEFVSRLDFGAVPGVFFLFFAASFWIVYTGLALWHFFRLRHKEGLL